MDKNKAMLEMTNKVISLADQIEKTVVDAKEKNIIEDVTMFEYLKYTERLIEMCVYADDSTNKSTVKLLESKA